jgi:hypothetical protein
MPIQPHGNRQNAPRLLGVRQIVAGLSTPHQGRRRLDRRRLSCRNQHAPRVPCAASGFRRGGRQGCSQPNPRSRTPSSIGSNQSSRSMMSAATAAVLVVVFVMAWSPFQRSNAGIIWVEHPGDYANPIPTTPATAPPLILFVTIIGHYYASPSGKCHNARYGREASRESSARLVASSQFPTSGQGPKPPPSDLPTIRSG